MQEVKEHMDNQEPHKKSHNNNSHLGLIVYIIVIVIVAVGIIAIVENHKNTTTKTTAISYVAPAKVSITKTGFSPEAVTVTVGQAVTWTNNDNSGHQIASDPYPKDNTLAGLNSHSSIPSGHTYSYTFTKAGTYYYHDNLNPYTLKGEVIVK